MSSDAPPAFDYSAQICLEAVLLGHRSYSTATACYGPTAPRAVVTPPNRRHFHAKQSAHSDLCRDSLMRTPLCLPLKLQFAISIAYFNRTSWTGDGFAEDCVLRRAVSLSRFSLLEIKEARVYGPILDRQLVAYHLSRF